MQVPEKVKELHRSLSPHAADLLDAAAADPVSRQPLDIRSLVLEGGWVYPFNLQPWPAFVGGPKLAEMRRAATGLRRLMSTFPSRFFDGDPERIARFYGFGDAAWLALALAEPTGIEGALCRSDFLDTADGLKCLEFNFSVMLAGWDIRFLAGVILGAPWLQPILRKEPRAVYLDPLLAAFGHWVTQAREAGLCAGGELNVAYLIRDAGNVEAQRPFFAALSREYQRYLAQLSSPLRGTLSVGSYEEVTGFGGEIQLLGRRIHAVLEAHRPPTPRITLLALKRRTVQLYNGPLGPYLGDKRNLALLSEAADAGPGVSSPLDAEERALVRAHLPWTRIARPGWTEFRGERVRLPDWAREHREGLVLKAGVGHSGRMVRLGAATEPEEWRRLLDEACESRSWILQERVEPQPLWFQTAQEGCGAGLHDVVWGLFTLGETYGGGFLRMLPCGGPRTINTLQGASEGLMLEVPSHSEAGFSSSSSSQSSSHASPLRMPSACSASVS